MLFYLLFLVIMGVPVLTMELAVGRASRQSAVKSSRVLEKPGSKWHIHGWFAILGNYLLMMFYTTVAGWMLNYFVKFVSGAFNGITGTEEINAVFTDMMGDPAATTFWMAVIVVAGFIVCSFGLQSGLERI